MLLVLEGRASVAVTVRAPYLFCPKVSFCPRFLWSSRFGSRRQTNPPQQCHSDVSVGQADNPREMSLTTSATRPKPITSRLLPSNLQLFFLALTRRERPLSSGPLGLEPRSWPDMDGYGTHTVLLVRTASCSMPRACEVAFLLQPLSWLLCTLCTVPARPGSRAARGLFTSRPSSVQSAVPVHLCIGVSYGR